MPVLQAKSYGSSRHSDLSKADIAVHGAAPESIVSEVRNWLDSSPVAGAWAIEDTGWETRIAS